MAEPDTELLAAVALGVHNVECSCPSYNRLDVELAKAALAAAGRVLGERLRVEERSAEQGSDVALTIQAVRQRVESACGVTSREGGDE